MIIFIHLFNQAFTQSYDHGVGAQCQEKRQEGENKVGRRMKKKGIGAEDETLHPNPGNGCANRGIRTEWKAQTGSGSLTQLPWTIWFPLTTRMDHTVDLF